MHKQPLGDLQKRNACDTVALYRDYVFPLAFNITSWKLARNLYHLFSSGCLLSWANDLRLHPQRLICSANTKPTTKRNIALALRRASTCCEHLRGELVPPLKEFEQSNQPICHDIMGEFMFTLITQITKWSFWSSFSASRRLDFWTRNRYQRVTEELTI